MSMDRPYDISGWATMCNIKCSDGRVIRPNAFAWLKLKAGTRIEVGVYSELKQIFRLDHFRTISNYYSNIIDKEKNIALLNKEYEINIHDTNNSLFCKA